MSKPFFEVFPSLQLNTDIRDLMGQTEVERVSATKRRDFLRVYLKSTRLIQKADYLFDSTEELMNCAVARQ